MKIRKQLAVVAAGAVAAVALAAGPAAAAGNGNGVVAKDCFGAPYGKTGLQYGQFKASGHPGGPYGLPQVLAAHGPDGAIPLCAAG
ncbi:MAG: hypothetical protein U0W40_13615 [Acidimicrobiia bacterium]